MKFNILRLVEVDGVNGLIGSATRADIVCKGSTVRDDFPNQIKVLISQNVFLGPGLYIYEDDSNSNSNTSCWIGVFQLMEEDGKLVLKTDRHKPSVSQSARVDTWPPKKKI